MLSKCDRSIPLPVSISLILSESTTKTEDRARIAIADFDCKRCFLYRAFFLAEMQVLQLPSIRAPFLWNSLNDFVMPQRGHALAVVPPSCVLLALSVSLKSIPYMYGFPFLTDQCETRVSAPAPKRTCLVGDQIFGVAWKRADHEHRREDEGHVDLPDF